MKANHMVESSAFHVDHIARNPAVDLLQTLVIQPERKIA